MNDQLIIAGFVVLLVTIAGLSAWVSFLHKKIKHLVRGRDGASLEELIHDALHTVDHLQQEHESTKKHQKRLYEKVRHCVQTPSTLRFNPFRDSGGNQSFAASFIDEQGNGVIISSLYTHGKTSIFAKPIQGHESEYDLTHEEHHVLQQAKNQVL